MIYKKYEIVAEAITGRAEYSLDDNGELYEHLQDIYDDDLEISYYAIVKNGVIEKWFDTLDEAKQYIDKLKQEVK
jgi:hypothetical protein